VVQAITVTRMKTKLLNFALLLCSILALPPASAQGFEKISLQPSQALSLTLTSSVPAALKPYFEIVPVEISSNLTSWTPWLSLFLTNRSSNAVQLAEKIAGDAPARFYRTPDRHLITPLPLHTGSFHVGSTTRLFTDSSRSNRYSIKTNSSFVAQFWYPSAPQAGLFPAPYIEAPLRNLALAYYSDVGLSVSSVLLSNAVGHSLLDSELLPGPWPVVIFSHGYQCFRTMDTDIMEDLASQGYITVAVDHADASFSLLPDGRVVHGNAPALPLTPAQNIAAIESRKADIQFLLQEIARLNDEDLFFHRSFNLDRIGMFGHSFGGAITADICASETRVKAGLSLDGGGHTNLLALTIDKPFLIASGDDSNSVMLPFREDLRRLYDQLSRDAYWFQLTSAAHWDFVEAPWLAPALQTAKLRRAITLRAFISSFFNKYLKALDNHLLDQPLQLQDVTGFLAK
jgi:predicted dienelactone hydrolase